jgi:glycerophosphoryl diester phosphodiesterase
MFKAHPDWVKAAHDLGMSVNAWTVNEEDDINKMIELGVDAITTNEPLLVRSLLGNKEYKKKR